MPNKASYFHPSHLLKGEDKGGDDIILFNAFVLDHYFIFYLDLLILIKEWFC
jgi:hypothetical protein